MTTRKKVLAAAGLVAAWLLLTVPSLFVLAWFALLGITLAAAIPPLHGRVLGTIGWRHLPLIGRTTGVGATLLLATGSCGALFAGAAALPPPSPTPASVVTTSASATPAATLRTTAESTSVPAVVTSAAASATPAPAPSRTRAQVLSVTDGDTIRVTIDGKSVPVRYIGIDTPETVDPRKSVQCFGKEATAFNASLVAGKTVELEKDVSETDKYDRLLRYVWLDGKLINEELVRGGYARSSSYPPDVKYQDRLRAVESEARGKSLGLWAESACAVATPAPTPVRTPPTLAPPPTVVPTSPPVRTQAPVATTNPRAGCDPAYPTVCIPPAPPDLDCGDIPYRRFQVLPPDPHRFDGNDRDGIGCES